jgi:hypothetical protein
MEMVGQMDDERGIRRWIGKAEEQGMYKQGHIGIHTILGGGRVGREAKNEGYVGAGPGIGRRMKRIER